MLGFVTNIYSGFDILELCPGLQVVESALT